jgi:hypothetical protein
MVSGQGSYRPRWSWRDTGFVAELAAMEIERLFMVMAVIGLRWFVSTVAYLLAR